MDKKILSNYIYSVLYQVLGYIIPLITAPYISRVLEIENIGVVSYSKSIVQYFSLFALLGINNYGNREIAIYRDDPEAMRKIFWNIYAIQCLTSILVLISYWYSYEFFNVSEVLIMRIQSLYIVGCLLDISWFFFGLENFKITVTRNMIIKCISLVLTFACIHQREDVWKYVLISNLSTVLANIILWVNAFKIVKWKKPSMKEMLLHIRPILILFIPVVTISLYKIMDKIMLGYISDMVQSGLYENAEKIINIPLSLVTAFANVMLPRMANIYVNGKSELSEKLLRKSMQFSMFLAIPIAFGLKAIAPIFVPIYFGRGYEGCAQIISCLSITVVFISWTNVIRAQYLIPNKREKEYTISVLSGAVVNLALNFILIPRYGAGGAALGTVLAEVSVTVSQVWLTRKNLPYFVYIKDLRLFVFASLIMYIGVYLLRNICLIKIVTLLLQILVGTVLYFIGVFGLDILSKKLMKDAPKNY